jgi:nucleoside-diphosphate-sugar epimerase
MSIYGSTGFIGKRFIEITNEKHEKVSRNKNDCIYEDVLYLISTTDNYNIFDKPFLDVDTNLNKLIKVLEAYRNSGKKGVFNFVSSWFVYGMNSSLNTKETDYCDPRGFYSITKRAAEQMLICYCNTFGIKYRIMRLTNIVGEQDCRVSSKKNAIQYMIGLLKENKQVNLYDGGNSIRDFMYIDDACRALNICMKNAPVDEIINISNMQPVEIKKVIHYCKEKLASTSDICSIDTPNFHKIVQVKDVCLNNDKLLSYGYRPSIDTMQGIEKILNSL